MSAVNGLQVLIESLIERIPELRDGDPRAIAQLKRALPQPTGELIRDDILLSKVAHLISARQHRPFGKPTSECAERW